MQHVAADRDDEAFQPALAALDGKCVEQRLGGMLVGAVAGVDHGGIDLLGEQVGGAGLVVPYHQQVAVHGVEGGGGVQQGLALVHRGGGDRHVDHVGTQPLAGEFEAGAGAGRVLEEQVDQRAAAQQVALGLAGAVEQNVALGQVEQMADLGGIKALDRQEMLFPVRHDPWSQKAAAAVNVRFGSLHRGASAPQHATRMLCRGGAETARGQRPDLRLRPVRHEVRRTAAIAAVGGGARAGPVDSDAPARLEAARLDDEAATALMHGLDIELAGDADLIGRDRRDMRPDIARHRILRVEGDDVADLGTEGPDLLDQADCPYHAGERDSCHTEKDGADSADLAVVWLRMMCMHDWFSTLSSETQYRPAWFIFDEVNCEIESVNILIIKKKWRHPEVPPRVWGGVQERGEHGS